jgi:hypothetical protein
MLKYTALLVSVSLASLMLACSSDDGDDGSGVGASASAGTGPVVNLTGGANGIGNSDGGTRPLTDEQITQIQMGACAGWRTEGEPLPAVLMLVVDVSGSMNESPDSNGNDQNCGPDPQCESKWEITRDALSDAIGTLPASSSVGVLYYPNGDSPENDTPTDVDACVNVDEMVPIGLLGPDGSMHRDDVLQSLDDANTGNYTPTHDAYTYGFENALRPYATSSPKFMLLITDGAPTMSLGCVRGAETQDMPTAPIIATVAAAAAEGIKTFIIGSPGSEQSAEMGGGDMRPWLSEAAMQGGTAIPGCSNAGPNYCHMDMTQSADFAAALREGLGSVAQQIATCTYAIPTPSNGMVIDTGAVNLIVHSSTGSVLVLPDGQGGCTEGWTFNTDGSVQLCDATCAAVQADASARVELLFGCAPGDIPVQ